MVRISSVSCFRSEIVTSKVFTARSSPVARQLACEMFTPFFEKVLEISASRPGRPAGNEARNRISGDRVAAAPEPNQNVVHPADLHPGVSGATDQLLRHFGDAVEAGGLGIAGGIRGRRRAVLGGLFLRFRELLWSHQPLNQLMRRQLTVAQRHHHVVLGAVPEIIAERFERAVLEHLAEVEREPTKLAVGQLAPQLEALFALLQFDEGADLLLGPTGLDEGEPVL